jgi:L-alanine-DL-glutamate epimerase-like enolase superfamily enzyme
MQIASLHSALYRIPLPTPLSDSTHGEIPYFELITVRVVNDAGLEGLGYTYTVGKGGGAVLSLIDRELAPMLIGQDPGQIERLWEQMWWRLHYVGRGGIAVFAISAIDIALWDLKGKRQKEALWRLLGGNDPRVPAYAGGIDLDFTLEALQEQTRSFLAQGFRAIKMKVGRPKLAEDLGRVKAVREIIGPDIPLMVDANMRWRVEEAIRASHALSEYRVYWLEEPTIPDDLAGHVRIARQGALPIATGENMHTLYEFQQFIGAGAVDFPEPDVSNVGGVTIWIKVAHLAEAHNLPVTSHGVQDLHVHLLAAVPNASYLEAHGFGLDRFKKHPLRMEGGDAIAPDRPGHGVELDWERLEAHRDQG